MNIAYRLYFIVTDGWRTDYKEAVYLIKNIDAKLVFEDSDYNTTEILSCLNKQNIK